jgi:acyl carrier protein
MMADSSGSKLSPELVDVLRTHLPALEPGAPLLPDVPLAKLGLDSLRAVNLVLDLEETFGVEFPDSLLSETNFQTARNLQALLHSLTGVQSA